MVDWDMAMARFLNLRCRLHFGLIMRATETRSAIAGLTARIDPDAPSSADLLRGCCDGGFVPLALGNHAIALRTELQKCLCLGVQTRQVAIYDCLADHAPRRLGTEIVFIVEPMHHL